MMDKLEIPMPESRHGRHGGGRSGRSPARIGYPVMVRPSYVLGGRGMEVVHDDEEHDGLYGQRPSASPRTVRS